MAGSSDTTSMSASAAFNLMPFDKIGRGLDTGLRRYDGVGGFSWQ